MSLTGQEPPAPDQPRGEKVKTAINLRSVVLGQRLKLLAQKGRLSAATLRAEGRTTPAKLVEQAADRGEKLGDWLTGLDAERLTAYQQRAAALPAKARQAAQARRSS